MKIFRLQVVLAICLMLFVSVVSADNQDKVRQLLPDMESAGSVTRYQLNRALLFQEGCQIVGTGATLHLKHISGLAALDDQFWTSDLARTVVDEASRRHTRMPAAVLYRAPIARSRAPKKHGITLDQVNALRVQPDGDAVVIFRGQSTSVTYEKVRLGDHLVVVRPIPVIANLSDWLQQRLAERGISPQGDVWTFDADWLISRRQANSAPALTLLRNVLEWNKV